MNSQIWTPAFANLKSIALGVTLPTCWIWP